MTVKLKQQWTIRLWDKKLSIITDVETGPAFKILDIEFSGDDERHESIEIAWNIIETHNAWAQGQR